MTPVASIADAENAGGIFDASWSTQGTIAFTAPGVIHQVSDTGSDVRPLTRLEKGETLHSRPEYLPGGTGLLFNILTGNGDATARIAAESLKTGERRDLLVGGLVPRYAPSGQIVYTQGANLMAAPFNARRLVLSGTPVPVIEGVAPRQFSFSSTGSLVYVPGSVQIGQLRLVWVDRKGREQLVPAAAHNYVMPRVSPDGRRVAVAIEEADNRARPRQSCCPVLTRLCPTWFVVPVGQFSSSGYPLRTSALRSPATSVAPSMTQSPNTRSVRYASDD